MSTYTLLDISFHQQNRPRDSLRARLWGSCPPSGTAVDFLCYFFLFCLLLFPVQCAQSWIEITQMRFLFFVKDEANDLYTVSMLNIQDHSGHFLISLIELRNTIPRSFTMFHTVRRLRNASKPQKQFNGACELDTDDQEIQICDHTRHVNHEHRIFISDEFYKTRASAWL